MSQQQIKHYAHKTKELYLHSLEQLKMHTELRNNTMTTQLSSIYLHKDDIETLKQFLDAFPEAHTVEVTSDTSSGIGAVTKATIHHAEVNGMTVAVTKTLVDESSW
jgi:hypothetical protein